MNIKIFHAILLVVFLSSPKHILGNDASFGEVEPSIQWSIVQLQKDILELQRNYEILRANPVPIGFLYTEYPGEPEPSTIWPTVTWTEVTPNFAGLFFRAAGGQSEDFGVVQNDQTRQIGKMQVSWRKPETGGAFPNPQNLSTTGWSNYGWAGGSYSVGDKAYEGLRFYTENVEVRPRNTAIRIWKRVE